MSVEEAISPIKKADLGVWCPNKQDIIRHALLGEDHFEVKKKKYSFLQTKHLFLHFDSQNRMPIFPMTKKVLPGPFLDNHFCSLCSR